ncbi:hypothetical protein ISF_07636 [Cordyceps fumosorosea ARSEF 2679]|uniref:Uncharacterized protein n=1 Tax=Cordyceps fumosorosea (strain ARSEF 2679) TaxID=1081104 RepID=A0A167NWY0_CORFA|nr:hypothetical protein ISF_07636 [Cordyceps fumosorosea ARSEF 2679]OAA56038.1 hypothetical protein ISF_07636 [Cordyceps fumosorosea ARSEF 2679]
MTPRTRSGGAAPPSSIVYKSTPSLKQVQFPARRRRVRTYGKQTRRSRGRGANHDDDDNDDGKENEQEGGSSSGPPPLKQKTLTQYDFASSFREEQSVIEISDASDVENLDKVDETADEAEKENNVPKGTKRRRSPSAKHAPLQPIEVTEQEGEEEQRVPDTEDDDDDDDDEGPVVRSGRRRARVGDFVEAAGKTKRRRTLGEEHRRSTMRDEEKGRPAATAARRRTLGDSPIAGPSRRRRYQTQTLTQLVGRNNTTSCVADSDADSEEELGGGSGKENDGFLQWLGDDHDDEDEQQQEPQSPTMGTQAGQRRAAAAKSQSPHKVWEDHSPSPRPSGTRRRQVGGGPAPTQHQQATSASQQQLREESVVPQTPIKSIARFGVPPSAQHVSPSPLRFAAIYGAPNIYVSPSTQRRGKSSSSPSPVLKLTGKPKKRAPIVGSSTAAAAGKKKQPAELVIADSFATEGWSSVGEGTQARHHGTSPASQQHQTQTQTQAEVFSTPAEGSAALAVTTAPAALTTQASQSAEENTTPPPPHTHSQHGQVEEKFYGAFSQIVQDSAVATQQQPPPQPQDSMPATPPPPRRTRSSQKLPPPPAEEEATKAEREIPDSDHEYEDGFGAETEDDDGTDVDDEDARFAAGAETQLLMDQLQSSVRKWSAPPPRAGYAAVASSSSVASPARPPRTSSPAPSPGSAALTPLSAPPSSSLKPTTITTKPPPARTVKKNPGTVANDIPIADPDAPLLRRPLPLLQHDNPIDTQGLPLESQRVPLAKLQGLPPAQARTDVLLPVSRATLDNLAAGRQDAIVLPFKVPALVVRLWLLCDGVLRYLACLGGTGAGAAVYEPTRDNGRGGRGTWSYRAAQVYELNNPAREEDMREEEWLRGRVTRYVYFPPAVVSQLLWNLRHALFADEEDEVDDAAVEEVATTPARVAAAHVALSSSSPLRRSARLSSTPARSRRTHQPSSSPLQHARRRPSQATTASQASTAAGAGGAPVTPRPGGEWSSESLVFDDHGGSSIPMPYSGVEDLLEASQLLTGSQTLPDSLVRDEADEEGEGKRVPDEICDSEEEE